MEGFAKVTVYPPDAEDVDENLKNRQNNSENEENFEPKHDGEYDEL